MKITIQVHLDSEHVAQAVEPARDVGTLVDEPAAELDRDGRDPALFGDSDRGAFEDRAFFAGLASIENSGSEGPR